ncbi:MAG: helix-turn-helix domain-containing protein, partial [Tepidisphaeraceae bacterium]
MSTDLATSSPLPSPEDPEIYSSESAHLGTFGDIDPNYRLNNVQCRAIELALDGLRWSQIAQILKISRKTLWRWKTQDRTFRQALADARA